MTKNKNTTTNAMQHAPKRSRTLKRSKRDKQTRYLSQAIQLEEAVNPHIIRATMTMVSIAFLTFIVWAGFTNVNEVARTPGEVVPHGYQQIVQHLEGGIIQTINVQEGDVVKAGQVLVTLEATSVRKDLQRALIKKQSIEMQAERLRAFVEDRQPNFNRFTDASDAMIHDQQLFFNGMRLAREQEEQIIHDQIKERKQSIRSLESDRDTAYRNLKLAQNVYGKRKSLNEKGYASDIQLLDSEREVNQISGNLRRYKNQILAAQAQIDEYNARLNSLTARHRDEAFEKLAQLETDRAQNNEIISKLTERITRLEIKAPTHGLIQGLSVNTIGSIVKPGETIMEIVPLEKQLEVAVRISPQDIGHLKIGQQVQVKFSTFDFSRYGSVQGRLDHISATTFEGENGDRFYKGRISLSRSYVGNDTTNSIMPGMTVMADVVTGKKTILQYMLKPIHTSLRTAFTER